ARQEEDRGPKGGRHRIGRGGAVLMAGEQESLFPHPRGEQEMLPLRPEEAAEQLPIIPPLDVPQVFGEAGSYEVRDELEALVRRDLLGPWDGETEQFRPRAMGPRERYLVGMLGPRSRSDAGGGDQAADPAQDVEASSAQGDGSEGELPEVLTPQSLGKL